MANEARKIGYFTPNQKRDPVAAVKYANEVDTLVASLNRAKQNQPRERIARLIAEKEIQVQLQENPLLEKDTVKKMRTRALSRARIRVGANKDDIVISDREWEAIQAGAVSHNRLTEILRHTDMDRVKELAMPRGHREITPAMKAKINAMLALSLIHI